MPGENGDIIPLFFNELVGDERLLYGNEWRQGAKLVGQLMRNVEKSKNVSTPEDHAVATSVCRLLEATVADDRIAHFHREFGGILERSRKESWDAGSINRHLQNLKTAYLTGEEEFVQEVTRRKLAQFPPLTSIPHARLRFKKENVARVGLYKFSEVHLSLKDQAILVRMEPAESSGMNSIAYPVKALKFTASEGQPIDMKVTFMFWMHHDIHQELPNHPELWIFIKKGVARVIDMYRESREELIRKRSSDGDEDDPFQLEKPFLEFLECKYLREKLNSDQYRSFSKALEYVNSSMLSAVVGLRAMAEQIFDEESSLRDGWFAEEYPRELQMVIKTARDVLKDLGCQIEDRQIVNYFEIVSRAARDSSFAKRLNDTWRSIFKGGDEIAMDMMREDVENRASIYRQDLYMSVFQKALEMARGVVTIEST